MFDIGTTNPTAKLYVQGPGGVSAQTGLFTDGTTSLLISAGDKAGTATTGWTTLDPNGGAGTTGVAVWDAFHVQGTTTTSGNVGIGTTNPTCTLAVAGRGGLQRVAATDALAWDFFNTSMQTMGTFFTAGSTNQFITGAAAGDSGFRAMGGKFFIGAGPTVNVAPTSPSLTVDTTGNVGIGTTAPLGSLDVGSTGSICLGESSKTA